MARTHRPKIPAWTRRDVYVRDDFTCRMCGWKPDGDFADYDGKATPWRIVGTRRVLVQMSFNGSRPDVYRDEAVFRHLTLDHVHPYSLGGSHDVGNLQTLCSFCNGSKGARVA